MAVTSIALDTTDNPDKYLWEQNIFCAHSPFRLKVNVAWNDFNPPKVCTIVIYESSNVDGEYYRGPELARFNLLHIDDVTNDINGETGTRSFLFIGDKIFKSLMEDFNDITSPEKIFDKLDFFTKDFSIQITSGGLYGYNLIETPIMFIHSAKQFGEKEYYKIPEIISNNKLFNSEQIWYGGEDKPVYLYSLVKSDESIYIADSEYGEFYAFDFDDVIFKANDDYLYKI